MSEANIVYAGRGFGVLSLLEFPDIFGRRLGAGEEVAGLVVVFDCLSLSGFSRG
jgi:hypothetical protein